MPYKKRSPFIKEEIPQEILERDSKKVRRVQSRWCGLRSLTKQQQNALNLRTQVEFLKPVSERCKPLAIAKEVFTSRTLRADVKTWLLQVGQAQEKKSTKEHVDVYEKTLEQQLRSYRATHSTQ